MTVVFRWGLANLLFATAIPGQQIGPLMSIDVQVISDFFVEVEHQPLAPLSRLGLAAPAQLPFPMAHQSHALSGMCTADAMLATRHDGYGNPMVYADFICSLQSAGWGMPARGASGMEIVVRFQSPQPVRGLLDVTIDIGAATGVSSQGMIFVDVGNDGLFDFALGGQSALVMRREFAMTVPAGGTCVRILHTGQAQGDNSSSASYRTTVGATFMPEVSALQPHRTGCERLHEVRWGNGAVAFMFEPRPGPVLCVLAVGSPVAPRAFRPGAGHCEITQSLDAFVVLQGFSLLCPPQLLPLGGQAVVQGFVFKRDGIWATDSWIVN